MDDELPARGGLPRDLLLAYCDVPLHVVMAYAAAVVWEDRCVRRSPPDADDMGEVFA